MLPEDKKNLKMCPKVAPFYGMSVAKLKLYAEVCIYNAPLGSRTLLRH